MSRQSLIGAAAILLVAVGGWAIAQPGAKKVEVPAGPFVVSPAGKTAALLDTASGRTWLLHPAADGRPGAWLPAERIDDPDRAAEWLAVQRKVRHEQEAELKVRDARAAQEAEKKKAAPGPRP